MKKAFWLVAVLSFGLSTGAFAHGHHHELAGRYGNAVGAALNSLEAIKHAIVIYDQLSGSANDRSYITLVGNAAVLAAHVYQFVTQAKEAHSPGSKHHRATVIVFTLANVGLLFDLAVDGVTTHEYWPKDLSVAKVAANLVAPLCIAFNLYSLIEISAAAVARST
jgi:hypothetical protein